MSEREMQVYASGYNEAVRDVAKALLAIANDPSRLPIAKALLEQLANGVESMRK